jgi:type 1 fimbriae regulatory protein FimB/type 1 fimbriae regulatory protein FimE
LPAQAPSWTIAAYLGHRNLQNTARYTAMSATRFNGLWQD